MATTSFMLDIVITLIMAMCVFVLYTAVIVVVVANRKKVVKERQFTDWQIRNLIKLQK